MTDMCLMCASKMHKGVMDKQQIQKLEYNSSKTILHLHNNQKINLSKKQFNEIKNNAVAMVATSVDFSVDIWAIQWPNDYTVKTINLANGETL